MIIKSQKNCVDILWKHQKSSLQYCCSIDIEVLSQKYHIWLCLQILAFMKWSSKYRDIYYRLQYILNILQYYLKSL